MAFKDQFAENDKKRKQTEQNFERWKGLSFEQMEALESAGALLQNILEGSVKADAENLSKFETIM